MLVFFSAIPFTKFNPWCRYIAHKLKCQADKWKFRKTTEWLCFCLLYVQGKPPNHEGKHMVKLHEVWSTARIGDLKKINQRNIRKTFAKKRICIITVI